MKSNKSEKFVYGDDNNLNLKLVVAINRTVQSEQKHFSHLLSEHGLTIAQFGVLEALYHIGPMNINKIIEKTLSTSGNMTVVIRNLVKMELITKECDPEDRRAFLVHLTEKGHRLISEIFPNHLKELSRVFSSLDFEEKQELLSLLKKLNRYESKK